MATIYWNDTLDKMKEDKIKELNRQCEETILGRFSVNLNETTYEFSYDAYAQSRFNGVAILFTKNQITEIEWTAYLNGDRVRLILNNTDFDIVSLAALQHCDYYIKKFNQLLTDVENADVNTIHQIVW